MENKTIKLLRSSKIYDSLKEAVQILNSVEHKAGQPIVVYYYSTEEIDRIDCIVAVGVIDGYGRKAYSILSSNNTLIVSKIYTDGKLEDITKTIGGSIYICYVKETNRNYWVFFDGNDAKREVEILNTNPILVKEAETGNYYWVDNKKIKNCSDFNTTSEFNSLKRQVSHTLLLSDEVQKHTKGLNLLLNRFYPFELTLDPPSIEIDLNEENTLELNPIELGVKSTYLGENVTNRCKYYEEDEERELIGGKIQISSLEYDDEEYQTIKISSKFTPIDSNVEETAETNLTIHYSYKTYWGKIIQGEDGKLPNWSSEEVKNLLLENKIFHKVGSFLGKKEEIEYKDSFELNQFPTLIIPYSYGELKNIIDPETNQSLLFDFKCYDDIELSNNLKYRVYIKKTGINSNGYELTISFKQI